MCRLRCAGVALTVCQQHRGDERGGLSLIGGDVDFHAFQHLRTVCILVRPKKCRRERSPSASPAGAMEGGRLQGRRPGVRVGSLAYLTPAPAPSGGGGGGGLTPPPLLQAFFLSSGGGGDIRRLFISTTTTGDDDDDDASAAANAVTATATAAAAATTTTTTPTTSTHPLNPFAISVKGSILYTPKLYPHCSSISP
ncbi:hypothetical protein E2C01_064937 [Portunus trituberculatus]|uniref:Uncharacterized protein n=1 Tax=Portunus trituberculatus TaxID=210409 RepID=A0A5B7HHI9_PORTR|nr:hypothetical protein [Portunus trituberculatus]